MKQVKKADGFVYSVPYLVLHCSINIARILNIYIGIMAILRKEMLNLDLQACFSNEMTEVTNDEAVFGVTFLIYAVKVVLRACCQWPAGLLACRLSKSFIMFRCLYILRREHKPISCLPAHLQNARTTHCAKQEPFRSAANFTQIVS